MEPNTQLTLRSVKRISMDTLRKRAHDKNNQLVSFAIADDML